MLSVSTGKTRLGLSNQQRASQRASTHTVRPSRSTTKRPIAVANLKDGADWLAKGFLKIFTPPNDGGVNWKGTSGGYSVNPRRGTRGQNPAPVAASNKDTINEAANDTVNEAEVIAAEAKYLSEAAQKEEAAKGVLAVAVDYIAGALQRVMGNNFKGDDSEPDWKATAERGWSGDSRKRDQDGFHNRKL